MLREVSGIVGLRKRRGIRRGSVLLDLSQTSFIDPYGMVCMWALTRHLRTRIQKVEVLLPNSRDVQGYMERMKLLPALRPRVRLRNRFGILTGISATAGERLLEVTRVRKGQDIGTTVIEPILGILGKALGGAHAANFTTPISEVCQNAREHSGDIGAVCVQRYTSHDGRRYVIIGVADLGVGIRASLGRRYPAAAESWDHETAIVNALKKEYSQFPGRGLGLYKVNQIVSDYEGSLHIRSGDTRLYIGQRAFAFRGAAFPGTQVCIRLTEPRT